MPVSGTCSNNNFQSLKAENATVLYLRGVKIFEDEYGNDLFKTLRKGTSGGSSELESVLATLLKRVETIEGFLQNLPPPGKGPKGDKGEPGEPGETGPQGPQGPRGKGATNLVDLSDVNIDGLDDGAVLMWSLKQKKWVVSLEE